MQRVSATTWCAATGTSGSWASGPPRLLELPQWQVQTDGTAGLGSRGGLATPSQWQLRTPAMARPVSREGTESPSRGYGSLGGSHEQAPRGAGHAFPIAASDSRDGSGRPWQWHGRASRESRPPNPESTGRLPRWRGAAIATSWRCPRDGPVVPSCWRSMQSRLASHEPELLPSRPEPTRNESRPTTDPPGRVHYQLLPGSSPPWPRSDQAGRGRDRAIPIRDRPRPRRHRLIPIRDPPRTVPRGLAPKADGLEPMRDRPRLVRS